MRIDTNHLGEKPIVGLFFGIAAPIAVGMMVNGLYNVVDAIFVTRVLGANAMGGISIVFPIQMLIFALAGLIGSGMASIVARQLGAKNTDHAQATIDMAIRLAIGFTLVLTVGIFLNMQEILIFMGVSEALMPYAIDYLLPITLLSIPITMLNQIPSDALRAEGKAVYMMAIMTLSALLNIALDAVFLFVLKSGVEGVAYATVISQFIALVISLWFFVAGKTQLKIRPFAYQPNNKILNEIVLLGVPLFISHAGVSIFIAFTNFSLAQLSGIDNDLYISAYGLIGRLVIFAILPVIAMTVAFQTIAGFNYGAQQYQRVLTMIKVGLIAALGYGLMMSTIMTLAPTAIISMFTQDEELIQAAIGISLWVFMAFPLANAHGLGCGLFQALGKAREALFLSSLRIYLLLLPGLIILPAFYGLQGLWLAFPIADGVAFVIVMILLLREGRRLKTQQYAHAEPTSSTEPNNKEISE
ncbi:MAG: MATE family efflux transporter [Gammaproteobacteria bacterium]|jgi:putative MATE family efflux protein|nr:MATE family efflux transporter [Gammaproteobacteria bacterium]